MRTYLNSCIAWPGLVAVCALSGSPVLAADKPDVHPFLTSRYSVQLGGFFPAQDTTLRVDGSSDIPNQPIDFEKSL